MLKYILILKKSLKLRYKILKNINLEKENFEETEI
jgi:hypothetical protein